MKRIMMVDDEEDQTFCMKIALENSYGDEYEVISACSGAECFELLKNNVKPDLILLDIMMPEMSGWETFNKLKENASWGKIPVVFITARTDEVAKNAGGFLGEDYIEKPVRIEELKEKIDKIFKKEQ
jgi:two-component system, OmpR family, response regulator VicR